MQCAEYSLQPDKNTRLHQHIISMHTSVRRYDIDKRTRRCQVSQLYKPNFGYDIILIFY